MIEANSFTVDEMLFRSNVTFYNCQNLLNAIKVPSYICIDFERYYTFQNQCRYSLEL